MPIQYVSEDKVAFITLTDTATANALGPDDWRALAAAVARAEADPAIVVIAVTGAGDHFSAGGNLQTMPARLGLPVDVRRAQLVESGAAIVAVWQARKPVIAIVDGAAVGAGLSLALAADVRVASARARFGAPFLRVGLTGDFGISWLLSQQIGAGRALHLLYTSELLDAARAQAIGLVEVVYTDDAFAKSTRAYVESLARGPAQAIMATKRAMRQSATSTLAQAVSLEAELQADISRTDDAREGVTAFLEKRAPRFR